MRRSRANRRKAANRWPELPRFRVHWKTLLVPPIVVLLLLAAVLAGKTLIDRPVRQLIVEGTFQRVTAMQIEAALTPGLSQGFLSLDLMQLQQTVESLDWIDLAQARRVWPDKVVVRVAEHQAAARWGDNGLLNVRGQLFTDNARYTFPELPNLAGPSGSEQQVATFYLAVRGRLATAHLMLDSLSMDARGALSLVLSSGQEVRLGRQDVNRRIDRFFEVVVPALAAQFERVDYMDLRYTNGFAVGWLEQPVTEIVTEEEVSGRG